MSTPNLARRWDVAAPAALAVLSVLFFWRQVFGGQLLLHEDLVNLTYPAWQFTREQVLAGHGLPVWDPFRQCGRPFSAGATVLYPLNALLLVLSAEKTILWTSIFHLWWAGYGLYLCLRRMGVSPASSLLGGAAWGFGSPMVMHLTHPISLAVAAWAPWFLLALLSGSLAGLTTVLCFQMLSGSPQWIAILDGAALVLAGRGRVVLPLVAAGVVSVLVSAVETLPLAEFSRHAVFPTSVHGQIGTFGWQQIPSMFLPELRPRNVQWADQGMPYWLATGPLLLALCAFRRKGVEGRLWALALAGPGLALLGGLAPSFVLFRFPDRWVMMTAFAVALLAAIGADRIKVGRVAYFSLLLVALASVWASGFNLQQADAPDAAATPPVFAVLHQRMAPDDRFMLVAPLPSTWWNWVEITRQFSVCGYDVLSDLDYHEFLCYAQNRRLMTPEERYMLTINHGVFLWDKLDPRFLALLHVRCVLRGDAASGQLIIQEAPTALPRYFLADQVTVEPDMERTFAALAGTADLRHQVWVQEAAEGGTFEPGQGTVSLTDFETDHLSLDVTTDHHALLVLSEAYDAGWIATVDGTPTPVLRADWVLRGVSIPPGSHHVQLDYAPASVRVGRWLSYLGLGLWVLVVASAFRRRFTADSAGHINPT